jgi:uracil phosphoribosyltransferase
MSINVLNHPLIQHKLTILRDKNTGVKEFREIVSEIAMLMCYEATRTLSLDTIDIETPIGPCKGTSLSGKKLAVVPILRAGLGMVPGMLNLIPSAKVAHIGLYRDPETLLPVEYYCKVPPDISERLCIILDPMLATGGTACAASQFLKNYGAKNIKLLTILSAPPGVALMEKEHPDVEIYTCNVDEKLN